jgi:hypothetical protein
LGLSMRGREQNSWYFESVGQELLPDRIAQSMPRFCTSTRIFQPGTRGDIMLHQTQSRMLTTDKAYKFTAQQVICLGQTITVIIVTALGPLRQGVVGIDCAGSVPGGEITTQENRAALLGNCWDWPKCILLSAWLAIDGANSANGSRR